MTDLPPSVNKASSDMDLAEIRVGGSSSSSNTTTTSSTVVLGNGVKKSVLAATCGDTTCTSACVALWEVITNNFLLFWNTMKIH